MREALGELIQHPWLLVVSLALSWPAYGMWAELLFGSKGNALRKLEWFARRDSRSLLAGEYHDDKFAEVRWSLVLALCALTVAAVYTGLSRFVAWIGS